jgi:hypothetical protein
MEGQAVITLILLTFLSPTRSSQSSYVALRGRELVAGYTAGEIYVLVFKIM